MIIKVEGMNKFDLFMDAFFNVITKMDFLGFQNGPKNWKSAFYSFIACMTIEIYCQLSLDYTFYDKICKIFDFELVMSKKWSFSLKFCQNSPKFYNLKIKFDLCQGIAKLSNSCSRSRFFWRLRAFLEQFLITKNIFF